MAHAFGQETLDRFNGGTSFFQLGFVSYVNKQEKLVLYVADSQAERHNTVAQALLADPNVRLKSIDDLLKEFHNSFLCIDHGGLALKMMADGLKLIVGGSSDYLDSNGFYRSANGMILSRSNFLGFLTNHPFIIEKNIRILDT